MNQKEATIKAILSVLAERGVSYELNSPTPISSVLTSEDKQNVVMTLVASFQSGSVEMSDEAKSKYLNNESALKSYTSGLVSNWIRKTPEFNGGSKYSAKNPGSRVGGSDPQVKNLRLLLSRTENEDHRALIQAAIDKRIAELKPAKSIEVDMSSVPEHIRALITE